MRIGETIVYEGDNYIVISIDSEEQGGKKLLALTLDRTND